MEHDLDGRACAAAGYVEGTEINMMNVEANQLGTPYIYIYMLGIFCGCVW